MSFYLVASDIKAAVYFLLVFKDLLFLASPCAQDLPS